MLREIQWLKRRLSLSKASDTSSNFPSSEAHLALEEHREVMRSKFGDASFDTQSLDVLHQPPTFHIKSGSIGLASAADAGRGPSSASCVLDLSDVRRCMCKLLGNGVEVRTLFCNVFGRSSNTVRAELFLRKCVADTPL